MQKVSHQSALSAGWTDPLSELTHVRLSDAPSKAKPREGEGGSAVPVLWCRSTHGFSKSSLNSCQGARKHEGGSHPCCPLPSWHLVSQRVLPTKGHCPLSTLHISTVVPTTTTTGLLLGYLVMGKDGLTHAWHPFWRHLAHEEPASQARVSHCRED